MLVRHDKILTKIKGKRELHDSKSRNGIKNADLTGEFDQKWTK
jgi:hypothetical protein